MPLRTSTKPLEIKIMPNPTMVHKSILRAVFTLPGSPAAVIKITPAITKRMGATITAKVKRKLINVLIRSVNDVAPNGFGKVNTPALGPGPPAATVTATKSEPDPSAFTQARTQLPEDETTTLSLPPLVLFEPLQLGPAAVQVVGLPVVVQVSITDEPEGTVIGPSLPLALRSTVGAPAATPVPETGAVTIMGARTPGVCTITVSL